MDTRWSSMKKLSTYLQKNRAAICEYLDEKKPACTPSLAWWIQLLALDAVASEITAVVSSLQGLSTLLNQQKTQLEELIQSLMSLCPVQGPSNDKILVEIGGAGDHVIRGSFSVALADVRTFIEDQGNFVMDALEALTVEESDVVFGSIAGLFVGLMEGITTIVAQRDQDNNASVDDAPAVLPHDLCRLRTSFVCTYIRRYKVSEQFIYLLRNLKLPVDSIGVGWLDDAGY